MDEKQREQRMNYVEEAENLEKEHQHEELEEELREGQTVYEDDEDRFVEERQPEQVREPAQAAMEKGLVPLLDEREAQEFRSRWLDIQAEFVDDPRSSVERADELVASVINSITENFASERSSLEDQWNRGAEASTEDLRLAIQRYRTFFNRLLTLETSETAE